jgi:hypothetical protein
MFQISCHQPYPTHAGKDGIRFKIEPLITKSYNHVIIILFNNGIDFFQAVTYNNL